jgi:hypothetical protein
MRPLHGLVHYRMEESGMLGWLRSSMGGPTLGRQVDELTQALLGLATVTESLVWDVWKQQVSEEQSLSHDNRFGVRVEVLSFCIHLRNQAAYASGGPTARERLSDIMDENLFEGLLRNSFDLGNVDPSFDLDAWTKSMKGYMANIFMEAVTEYDNCRTLVSPMAEWKTSLVGTLEKRVVSHLPQCAKLPPFNMVLKITMVQGLPKFIKGMEIDQRVGTISRQLR